MVEPISKTDDDTMLELNERVFDDLVAWQERTNDYSESSKAAFLDAWELGRRYGEDRITKKLKPSPHP